MSLFRAIYTEGLERNGKSKKPRDCGAFFAHALTSAQNQFSMDPLFNLIIRLGLGILFATAAFAKLRKRRDFYAALLAYKLLPPRWAMNLGTILPWAEGAIALGLMIDVNVARVSAAGLLLAYALAMAVNISRGRRDIDCGCGGAPQPLSIWLLIRNLVLAGAALVPSFWPAADRPLKPVDLLIVIGALSALILLYTTSHRVLANSLNSGRK